MKKKKVWILSGVGVVIVVMAVIYILNGRTSDVGGDSYADMDILVQSVSEEELSETVLVTGMIIPEEEQKVFLDPESDAIKEYKVEENQEVKVGDILFIYDTAKVDTALSSAVRGRDLVQNQVKSEEAQIVQLNKQIEQAKKNFGKSSDIDEYVTQDDINQLENEQVQHSIELESTKAEVAAAQDEINEIDKQKQAMTVVSKIDGVIVKVNKNIEKTETGSGEPVVHIISNAPFKVVGSMSEFDTVKIKPDQTVIIRPKVFKDREWNGVVESVSQFPSDDVGGDDFYDGGSGGNVTMYPFKVGIIDDTEELRQGFHVSLEVKTNDKKVIAIPYTAIIDEMMGMEIMEDMDDDMFDMGEILEESDGPAYVYILADGLLEMREVEIGEMSDEFIEIVSGIKLGELVVIMPDEGMHDGMEVSTYDEIK